MWVGRNEIWHVARIYLQNSRDVGSTLVRARVVTTSFGLISSAGAANIADVFF